MAEALGEALVRVGVRGRRCLLLRSPAARPALQEILTAAGAECEELPVYRNVAATSLPDTVLEQLGAARVDWATFTSSSTFLNLVGLLGTEAARLLGPVKLASIGPVTSGSIREAGFEVAAEAAKYTSTGMVEAMLGYECKSG